MAKIRQKNVRNMACTADHLGGGYEVTDDPGNAMRVGLGLYIIKGPDTDQ